jgi:hypothetical protein
MAEQARAGVLKLYDAAADKVLYAVVAGAVASVATHLGMHVSPAATAAIVGYFATAGQKVVIRAFDRGWRLAGQGLSGAGKWARKQRIEQRAEQAQSAGGQGAGASVADIKTVLEDSADRLTSLSDALHRCREDIIQIFEEISVTVRNSSRSLPNDVEGGDVAVRDAANRARDALDEAAKTLREYVNITL